MLSAATLAILILLVDLNLELGVAAGVPYVFVVLLGVWFPWRSQVIFLALVSSVLIAAGYYFSPVGGDTWIDLTNRGFALFVLWVSAIVIVVLKSTASSLTESEQKFRDFAEVSSDWLWEMDADLRFTYLSDRVETVTGIPVAFHIGKTREDLAGEDYNSEKWVTLRKAIASRSEIKDFEYSRKGPNGIQQYISVSGKPVFDVSGKFLGYRGSGTDVSKQKSALDRAKRAEQQLRTAITSLEDGFVIFDADDRLVLCNEKYREIYSEIRDFLVPGAKFEDLLRAGFEKGEFPDAIGREEDWLAERMQSHLAGNTETLQRLSNGKWLKISERLTADGGIVGVRIDITELKKVQEKAEAANLAKSNFLSTMSHEIRTPLNGVLGLAQLLNDSDLNRDQRIKVNTILSSGQTLLAIINDVLDMSRIEAGGMELEVKPFLLNELVSTIATPFQSLADDKGLTLRVHNKSDFNMAMHGDPVRIRQILWNLLSNAIKFTEQGSVSLTIENITEGRPVAGPPKCLMQFTIADTGAGISDGRVDAIFAAFTQEDSTINRKHGGTGLGLSIVKQLTELMDGTIDVASELGKGTRFTVRLPFAFASAEEAEGLTLRSSVPGNGNAVPLNVLLAEDNEVNAVIAIAFLQKFGHSVRHAENGKIAVQIAAENWPDLVLMDVHMPEMNGIDATKTIRATDLGKNLPIIGLTAEAFAERHQQFIAVGMDDVLTKPFTEQQLANAIAFYGKKTNPSVGQNRASIVTAAKANSQSKSSDPAPDLERAMADTAVLAVGDADKLDEIRQQLGPETTLMLLQEAENSLRTHLEGLKISVQKSDSEDIRRTAHSIKGASGSLFAIEVSRMAAEIEETATDTHALAELMPRFEIAAQAAISWWREQA